MTDYNNPTPIAVLLIPVLVRGFGDPIKDLKFVGVVRSIEPFIGKVCLPGGYVDEGETVEVAAAREALEEAGINLDPEKIVLETSRINAKNQLLIFCRAPVMFDHELPPFVPNEEASARVFIDAETDFAFPLQKEVVLEYLR